MSCNQLRVTKTGNYPVALIPRDDLIVHEETVPENTRQVRESIEQTKVLNFPVVVDEKSNIILDGHHRYEALGQLGVECVPCYIINIENEAVQLLGRRADIPVNKKTFVDEILKRASPFPAKTTKFTFSPALKAIDLPLQDFMQAEDLEGSET